MADWSKCPECSRGFEEGRFGDSWIGDGGDERLHTRCNSDRDLRRMREAFARIDADLAQERPSGRTKTNKEHE